MRPARVILKGWCVSFWPLLGGFLLSMGIPLSSSSFTTTSLNQIVTWTVSGISDSQIQFVNRLSTADDEWVYYSAPLRANMPITLSAATTPTQMIVDAGFPDPNFYIWKANLALWIPSFGNWVYALSSWQAPSLPAPPPNMSLVHEEFYTHDSVYDMPTIHFNGLYWQTNGMFGKMRRIYIHLVPTEDLILYAGVEDVPWLKGWPDHCMFQPARRKKPKGCGLCSAMGLPAFRVNTSVLNPVIADTDFAYEGLGPDVALQRTYNADRSQAGAFGRGWSFTYDSALDSHNAGAVVRAADGRDLNFSLNTNTFVYTAPPGVLDTLAWTTNLPGQPGWGEFRLETRSPHEVYHYPARVHPGSARPPLTNGVPLSAISDLNSNRLTLAYTNGRLSAIQDAAGRLTTFKYSAAGLCTNVTVPSGGKASFSYAANSNLLQSLDLVGNLTVYTYSPTGILTSMNTAGKLWTLQYALTSVAPDFVTGVVDPLGYTNTYTLQVAPITDRCVMATDPAGQHAYYWSRDGMSWKEQDALGYQTTRGFSNGLVMAVTNARGFVRRMAYDARRNLVQLTDETGAVTAYAYTNFDRLAMVSNALGQVWRYTYDSKGNLTESRQPSGRRTVMTYNTLGQMLTLTDTGSNTYTYTYDGFGNVSQVTDPLGYTNRFVYDAAGIELTNIVNARGVSTRYAHDANRRRTRIARPDGSTKQMAYDCCAQSSVTDERGFTRSVERNARVEITAEIDALGNRTQHGYDAFGNLAWSQDPLGNYSYNSYDKVNRLSNTWKPLNRALYFEYDAMNLVEVRHIYRNPYRLTNDAANRVVSLTDPAGRATRYDRDLLGRITNIVNGRGQRVQFGFDADGRLASITNNGTRLAQFSHNGAGDLSSMITAQGVTTYARDKRRQVTQIAYPGGLAAGFTYDANGNLATLSYPGSAVVTYAYDNRDRVTNMTWAGQSMAFTYDAAGNLLMETRSNGSTSQYGYDGNGRVTNLAHRQGAAVMISLKLQRDARGDTTNAVLLGGYIPTLPVLAAGTVTGAYHPDMDDLTKWAGSTCGSDADGNLTNRTGSGAFTASYDAQHRLASGLRNGTNLVCQYDGFGRRVQTETGGHVRKFHYDHRRRLLFETDAANVVTAQYVWRNVALVAMWAAGKGWHFYHFDALGSTLALTDEQDRISALYRYLPYGMPANGYARVPNPFTFVGRYGVVDDGDGLYLMGARHYDARAGRFLQRDPIGFAGGWNLYTYADNNPVTRIDPSGTQNTGGTRKEEQSKRLIYDDIVAAWMEAREESGANVKRTGNRTLTAAERGRLKELEDRYNDCVVDRGVRAPNMTDVELRELAELQEHRDYEELPGKLYLDTRHMWEGSGDFSMIPPHLAADANDPLSEDELVIIESAKKDLEGK